MGDRVTQTKDRLQLAAVVMASVRYSLALATRRDRDEPRQGGLRYSNGAARFRFWSSRSSASDGTRVIAEPVEAGGSENPWSRTISFTFVRSELLEEPLPVYAEERLRQDSSASLVLAALGGTE